jgi:cellulose synthase/poly-beta-1,6-N-acetylglucosamine synthase-like glycosyltransferase
VIFPTFRFLLAWQVLGEDSSLSPSRDQLRASAGSALPVYTVIVALYQENARTVNALLGALGELDYPQEKLDVLLLLERDDPETWAAIEGAGGRPWLRVVEVPPGSPRTKPRALNYGLAAARGEFVAVYDAEDRPEPDQLRKAVWALRRFPRVACVQAKLAYYNPRQNLLTRWFTLEYQAWFRLTLPGLHKLNSALPLGGTSNHFKAAVLRDCGAWDPYNVTEDADLGIRLMRHGHEVRMLDSTTFEEAVSRMRPWIRQRTRWIKGYMQTIAVHTRSPWRTWRELGGRASLLALLAIAGSFISTLALPVFLALVAASSAHPQILEALFPVPIYHLGLASFVLGNGVLLMLGVAAAVVHRDYDLAKYALIFPLYWLLMSAAGYRALVELVMRPHHWHKTPHGQHTYEEWQTVTGSSGAPRAQPAFQAD